MGYGVAAPEQVGITRLADGRRVGWAAWRPEDGRPVLLCSGAALGRSLGFGTDHLHRLGVRLLTVDRPGLGASDSAPGRTLADWARDVEQLAAALALGDLRIAGFSQGASFALACAAAGLPRAVAIVAGQDDLAHPAFADRLDPAVSGLVRAVAADPAGVEASFAETASAAMLWELIVGSSSAHDLAVYTAPDFAPAFRRALDEGFTQGAAGYARDLVLALGRWPLDLGAIRVPVDLWYGERDASPVHSPDFGATLAERMPTARRRVLSDAGGSLLWTHAEAILTALLAAGDAAEATER